MPVQVVVSRPIELQSVSIRNLGEALASLSRVARLLVPIRSIGAYELVPIGPDVPGSDIDCH